MSGWPGCLGGQNEYQGGRGLGAKKEAREGLIVCAAGVSIGVPPI